MLAAVTATSGGVLFTGELTGDFLALESATGRELFRFRVGAPLAGGVVAYAIDNKPYIAAVAGRVGVWNEVIPDLGGGTPTIAIFSLP
jgi:alcohol dehydrogenase (cytochrome c)